MREWKKEDRNVKKAFRGGRECAAWTGDWCQTGTVSGTEASMQDDSTLYVGRDVHKDSIMVAYAVGMSDVELLGKIGTSQMEDDRLCKRLQFKATRIRIVYEAVPRGYGLCRRLMQKASTCCMCTIAHPAQTRRARQDRPA